MVGAAFSFLLLVQGQPAARDPQDVAKAADSILEAMSPFAGKNLAGLVDDEAFLKRVTRDALGVDPSADEIKAFLGDADPAKRSKAIGRIVDDDRFADFWSRRFIGVFFGDPEKLKFSEILDVPPGSEVRAVQDFGRWLRQKLKKDVPWTDIVFQMLDARGSLDGDPSLAYLLSFHRRQGLITEFAEGAARHLLGIRLRCAGCHDHPYDKWRLEDLYGLGAFIARQKTRTVGGVLQVFYSDQGETAHPFTKGAVVEPQFLFGGKPDKNDDRMSVLAGFMTHRRNTQLPRALANRVWAWLLGAGIVHPPDDFALTNKAMSTPLMELLVRDTIDHGYSLKRLVRVIANTRAYQMAMPEEAPGAVSFRQVMKDRVERGRYYPYDRKPAPLPIAFEPPAGWTPVRPFYGAKALYVVRGKSDRGRTAEVAVFSGKRDKQTLETGINQFVTPKTATHALDGRQKLALVEIVGLNTCIRGSVGPVEYASLAAVAEGPDGPWTFRLEGRADVVADWRDEFMAMLKAIPPAR